VLRVSKTRATKQTSSKMIKNPLQITNAKHSPPENSKGGCYLKKLPGLPLLSTHIKTCIAFIQLTEKLH